MKTSHKIILAIILISNAFFILWGSIQIFTSDAIYGIILVIINSFSFGYSTNTVINN